MPVFLERFFRKARPEDFSYEDLRAFLKQSVEEHQTLEYKPRGLLVKQDDTIIRPSGDRDISGFAALAKSVSAFANAEGGLLVLGVKERPEKYKGTTAKIRPGAISALPMSVSREMIENQLYSMIQYPVEGLTIVPLRSSARSKYLVYLIDVPQSERAPHRVNELHYFQRYNFSCLEMKHWQIADLFGRRRAPSLDVSVHRVKGLNEGIGQFTLRVTISNRGAAVAKYVTCICGIAEGAYDIPSSGRWTTSEDRKSSQWETGFNHVIYPDIPTNTGNIDFRSLPDTVKEPMLLIFSLYAENMSGKQTHISVPVETMNPLE